MFSFQFENFRKVTNCIRNRKNPVIIHDDIGSSRAGVYTLIDSVMAKIENKKKVNFKEEVSMLRACRPNMIRTKEQLQFVIKALDTKITGYVNKAEEDKSPIKKKKIII